MEDPILRRRDRTPTITVRGDIAEGLQPPDVSAAIQQQLQPILARLPAGYRIEQAGAIEESDKATKALLPLFPIMLALTLLIIILQVRSISAMVFGGPAATIVSGDVQKLTGRAPTSFRSLLEANKALLTGG